MNFREFSNTQRHCNSVLGLFFELNSAEIEVYRYLVEGDGKTAREIGEFIGKDRSTAYRMLERLRSAGVVDKRTEYLPKGGYYHIYEAKDPALLIEELKMNIRESCEKILDLVEKAEESKDVLSALTSVLSEGAYFGTSRGSINERVRGKRGKNEKKVPAGQGKSDDRKNKGAGTGSKPEPSGDLKQGEEDDGGEDEEEDDDSQIPIHLR